MHTNAAQRKGTRRERNATLRNAAQRSAARMRRNAGRGVQHPARAHHIRAAAAGRACATAGTPGAARSCAPPAPLALPAARRGPRPRLGRARGLLLPSFPPSLLPCFRPRSRTHLQGLLLLLLSRSKSKSRLRLRLRFGVLSLSLFLFFSLSLSLFSFSHRSNRSCCAVFFFSSSFHSVHGSNRVPPVTRHSSPRPRSLLPSCPTGWSSATRHVQPHLSPDENESTLLVPRIPHCFVLSSKVLSP